MKILPTAQNILDLAIALKPSGSIEGFYNICDQEVELLNLLRERLQERAQHIVSLSNAIGDYRKTDENQPEIDVSDLEKQLPSLTTTVTELSNLISPIIEPISRLAKKVKEQNDNLLKAIKAFVNRNYSKFDLNKIPRNFLPDEFLQGLT
jgi:hypothetical protein